MTPALPWPKMLLSGARPPRFATGATPPNWKAKPTAKYAISATANAAMFIIIMCPAFFALVRPVTRNAKPTCMNSTRNPVMSSQTKLIDTRRWPASLASLLMPTWDTGTFVAPAPPVGDARKSDLFPVVSPAGSAPWWFVDTPTTISTMKVRTVSAMNFCRLLTSSSVPRTRPTRAAGGNLRTGCYPPVSET